MKSQRGLAVIVIVLALASAASSTHGQGDDMTRAFAAAAAYEWGGSRVALVEIQGYTDRAMSDPTLAVEIERHLVGLLAPGRDVTPAARDFACRQLRLVGSPVCVPALAAWFADDSMVNPVLYALEAMPAPEAHAALIEAAATNAGPAGPAIRHALARREVRVARLRLTMEAADVPRLLRLSEIGSSAARNALARTRRPGIDDALAAAVEADDDRRAALAVRLLGERGATSVYPMLDRIAGSPQRPATLRCAAMLAIVELHDWRHDPRATGRLIEALVIAESIEDEQAVLAAMERHGDPDVLPRVLERMKSGRARTRAAMVAIALVMSLPPSEREAAQATLRDIAARYADEPAVRRQAGEAIARIEANESYIDAWVVAGPFEKSAATGPLIDHPFAPEAGDAGVHWQTPAGGAMRAPGIVDLNEMFRGGDRCAYGRAVLVSEGEQDARLELGSDDGVKVWLNGEVVHRNDVMRGLSLRQDVVPIRLRDGRNVLLVKVTQGGGDWQFAVRVRGADGFALEGLAVEP